MGFAFFMYILKGRIMIIVMRVRKNDCVNYVNSPPLPSPGEVE